MAEAGQDLVAQLEAAVRSQVVSAMGDPSGELAAMGTDAILSRWFNWRDRQVEPRPRNVHESSELLCSQEASDHATELSEIKAEIVAGADLTPRLSNRAQTAYTPSAAQGPLQHRHDLDLLISDWGIHHLHLAQAPDRSGLLLFVVFRPDDAYLVQLLPHGHWSGKSLVEIIMRNWPDAGMLTRLNGAVGLTQNFADSEHQMLRQAGLSQLVEIDGAVYMARPMSLAGMAVDSTRRADQIMRTLHAWRERLSSDPLALDVLTRSNGFELSGSGAWEPYVYDREFGFREPTTTYLIRVGFL